MTATPTPNIAEDDAAMEAEDEPETESLDTDDVFHLLQNQRRRRTLRYLREHDEGDGVDMRDIVEWIAAKEHDTTVEALRSKERQRVYIALYQAHLPKLDKLGIVDYDQRRGWVTLRDEAEAVMPYLSVDDGSANGPAADDGGMKHVFATVALGAAGLLVTLAVTGAYAIAIIPLAISLFGVLSALGATPLSDWVRAELSS